MKKKVFIVFYFKNNNLNKAFFIAKSINEAKEQFLVDFNEADIKNIVYIQELFVNSSESFNFNFIIEFLKKLDYRYFIIIGLLILLVIGWNIYKSNKSYNYNYSQDYETKIKASQLTNKKDDTYKSYSNEKQYTQQKNSYQASDNSFNNKSNKKEIKQAINNPKIKEKTSDYIKLKTISYRLKTIKASKCKNGNKECLKVTLEYPVEIKGEERIVNILKNHKNKKIPYFNPNNLDSYYAIMGLGRTNEPLPPSGYEYSIFTNPISETKKIICIEDTKGGYTGGMHSSSSVSYTCYSKVSGRVLKLQDILNLDSFDNNKKLKVIAEKYFRLKNNISTYAPLTSIGLFSNKFKLAENYYFTDNGIVFYYNPYDIAPYGATGGYKSKFTVPYKDIASIIKKDEELGEFSNINNNQLAANNINLAVNNKQKIERFINDFFASSSSDNILNTLEFYDDVVKQYFSIKNATHQDILKDKMAFYKKWTVRKYFVKEFEVLSKYEQNNNRFYVVNVFFSWNNISSNGISKSGNDYINIILKESGNSFVITAIKSINPNKFNTTRKQNNINITNNEEIVEEGCDDPIFNKSQDTITLNNENMNIKLHYKIVGNKIKFNIEAQNKTFKNLKGGVSISFPMLDSAYISNIDIGSFNTLKVYPKGSKIWNRNFKSLIWSKYLLIEAWSKNWRANTIKRASFEMDITNIIYLKTQLRGALSKDRSEYLTPTIDKGIIDEQGYATKRVGIDLPSKNISKKINSDTITINSENIDFSSVVNLRLKVVRNNNFIKGTILKGYLKGNNYIKSIKLCIGEKYFSNKKNAWTIKSCSQPYIINKRINNKLDLEKYNFIIPIENTNNFSNKWFVIQISCDKNQHAWCYAHNKKYHLSRIKYVNKKFDINNFKYVCYNSKYKEEYIGCSLSQIACYKIDENKFGKYPNTYKSLKAFFRCINSRPRFSNEQKYNTTSSNGFIDTYYAKISQKDKYSSSGKRLKKVSAILQQDRANYHKFHKRDPEDTSDKYFTTREHRDRIKYMLKNSTISKQTKDAILYSNPLIKVTIYKKYINVESVLENRNTNYKQQHNYPYICYNSKTVKKVNGKKVALYKGCYKSKISCKANGSKHFGRYQNDYESYKALNRCNHSIPRFID